MSQRRVYWADTKRAPRTLTTLYGGRSYRITELRRGHVLAIVAPAGERDKVLISESCVTVAEAQSWCRRQMGIAP